MPGTDRIDRRAEMITNALLGRKREHWADADDEWDAAYIDELSIMETLGKQNDQSRLSDG